MKDSTYCRYVISIINIVQWIIYCNYVIIEINIEKTKTNSTKHFSMKTLTSMLYTCNVNSEIKEDIV